MRPFEQNRIDSLLQEEVSARGAGAAIGITRHGACVYARGYGQANVEWETPVTPDTVFPIASISKPLTALGVMMLVEDGKLALEDPIDKFLPPVPGSTAPIRIEHLLSHTSGIRNINDVPGFESDRRLHTSLDDLLAHILRQPCGFTPGTKWSYSNSGYVLLSYLIEKVSGLSFGRFMRHRLFEPLGMKQSLLMHDRAIVPKRACDYQSGPLGIERADFQSFSWYRGAGALASTIEDLIRLDAGLFEGKVVSENSFARMLDPVRLADGSVYPYGLGWGVSEYIGHAVHHHTGGFAGFRCELLRIPNEGVAIIVLANHKDFQFHKVTCSLARAACNVPPVNRTKVEASSNERRAAVGCFVSPDGAELNIRDEGSSLFSAGVNDSRLNFDRDGSLYNTEDPEVTLHLEHDSEGRVSAVTLVVPMFSPLRFVREPSASG